MQVNTYITERNIHSYICTATITINNIVYSAMPKGVRLGGRKAGTPNKVTKVSKELIAKLVGDYSASGLLDSDLAELDPKSRIDVMVKLMSFVLPKMQSVAFEAGGDQGDRTIEDDLISLVAKQKQGGKKE